MTRKVQPSFTVEDHDKASGWLLTVDVYSDGSMTIIQVNPDGSGVQGIALSPAQLLMLSRLAGKAILGETDVSPDDRAVDVVDTLPEDAT